MPTPDLHPDTIMLIDRMTGPPPDDPSFIGEEIDLTRIDALALGDLWAVAHAKRRWYDDGPEQTLAARTARAILDLGRTTEPAFRASACRDHLDLLARKAEGILDNNRALIMIPLWPEARFALERCIDLSVDTLGAAARRFLAAHKQWEMPHLAIALARLVGQPFAAQALEKLTGEFRDSPLFVDELRIVAGLDLSVSIKIASEPRAAGIKTRSGDEAIDPLPDDPTYVSFAEIGLTQATERVRKIHDLEAAYASDKAFTIAEAAVIARLARVGLARDASWLPPVLDELFRKVSLAPNAARTVPSQSVAIALGYAIEAFPTPEAVATLREVVRNLRHAGLKKKLQRNVGAAELALVGRPEIALRLPLDQPISKPQLTTLTRCLDASLALGVMLTFDEWSARLAGHPQVQSLTGRLLWRVLDGAGNSTTILPTMDHGRLSLRDAADAIVTADCACRVTLWQPTDATAEEREAWRDRLAALQIRQPFKQVFREHYAVPADEASKTETAMFFGHGVSIGPMLGLARREGWRIDDVGLARSYGRWTAKLEIGAQLYPGCVGGTTTGNVSLWTSGGKASVPVRLGDLPAAALSEMLRAVDLLVSTSSYALIADDEAEHRRTHLERLAKTPLGPMAEMRKQALERALRGLDGMAGLHFDARHLRLGPYAIHLATGRVTRDGEAVTIDLPKRGNLAAVPWLPYDETLLETIAYTVFDIARRQAGSSGPV